MRAMKSAVRKVLPSSCHMTRLGRSATVPIARCQVSRKSSSATPEVSEREQRMRSLLNERLQPTKLALADISGGCGAMYNLEIHSPQFKGMSLVQQHRLVNEVLKQEIKDIHGMSLKTQASSGT